jgi:perosamine synthetase
MKHISHSKPALNKKDLAAVNNVLKSGALVQGRYVSEFEGKVSRYLGVKAGVAVNSGTSALHLALLALGVGPKDEVILPSFVCSALLNAVSYTGARPRIVDVNEDDFNISPLEVKKALNKRTKAIIVPHMFGYPADLRELSRFGVPVIEDCAQSIGARYRGRRAGSFGVVSICSFYATKVITTGEGGMVLSDQTKISGRIRDLRQYDHASNSQTRYNYKMTDFQAALGISQLQRMPEFIKRRKQIAHMYDRSLTGLDLILPPKEQDRSPIYYRYVIKVRSRAINFIEQLRKKGIGAAAPVFQPLHHLVQGAQCPMADQLMGQCVSIPIYPDLTNGQVLQICDSIYKTSSS